MRGITPALHRQTRYRHSIPRSPGTHRRTAPPHRPPASTRRTGNAPSRHPLPTPIVRGIAADRRLRRLYGIDALGETRSISASSSSVRSSIQAVRALRSARIRSSCRYSSRCLTCRFHASSAHQRRRGQTAALIAVPPSPCAPRSSLPLPLRVGMAAHLDVAVDHRCFVAEGVRRRALPGQGGAYVAPGNRLGLRHGEGVFEMDGAAVTGQQCTTSMPWIQRGPASTPCTASHSARRLPRCNRRSCRSSGVRTYGRIRATSSPRGSLGRRAETRGSMDVGASAHPTAGGAPADR